MRQNSALVPVPRVAVFLTTAWIVGCAVVAPPYAPSGPNRPLYEETITTCDRFAGQRSCIRRPRAEVEEDLQELLGAAEIAQEEG